MTDTFPRIVALVPMRHTSERVPGKNYRPFNGEPLYRHVVRSLLASGRVAEVVINTDSQTIMEDARDAFPMVRLLQRPKLLLGGDVPMNEIIRHDLALCEADLYLQTHSTNPLLTPGTIARAIDAYLAAQPAYDSLFSVTRLQTRLWDANARPVNHTPAVLLRTQDLPPLFEENSNIFLFSKDSFLRHGNRIGEHPLLFEIDRDEAWDIDEESDFRIAEVLHAIKQGGLGL